MAWRPHLWRRKLQSVHAPGRPCPASAQEDGDGEEIIRPRRPLGLDTRMTQFIPRRRSPRPKALWVQAKQKQSKESSNTSSTTRLWRSTSGRMRRSWRKRLRRPRPIAEKRRRLLEEYRTLRITFLLSKPRCEKNSKLISEDVHHSRGRAGTLLLDVRFWKAVARKSHDWIQAHPEEARARGLLCQPGEWNRPPRDAETARLRALMMSL